MAEPKIRIRTRDDRLGNATAQQAARILVEKNLGFAIPSAQQKRNLAVAFVRRDMIIYGKAFDIVKMLSPVDLDDPVRLEANLDKVQLFEIKSTNRPSVGPGFERYFFGLTAAEVLVAQSLKTRFRFAFVNTVTREHLELGLADVFARAKGIYPTWSISF